MKAVIDETLRLFPPVPLNQRQSRPLSCTLPAPDRTFPHESHKPLYMPKSTVFIYSTLLMQRNKGLWGHDADIFDPERWLDPKRLSRYTSNPMMFTPFSAGPRIVSIPSPSFFWPPSSRKMPCSAAVDLSHQFSDERSRFPFLCFVMLVLIGTKSCLRISPSTLRP